MNLPGNYNSAQQHEILDCLPALIFLECAGSVVYANAEARQAMGIASGDWAPAPVEEILWGLLSGTAEPQTELTGGAQGNPFHATLAGKDGQLIPVEGAYSILDSERGEAIIVAQVVGREQAPKPKLMEDVLASFPDAVAIVNGNRILYTNPAFNCLFRFSEDEVVGRDLISLIVPETRRHENAVLQRTVQEQGRASIETVRVTKDGDLIDIFLQVAPLLVNGDQVGHLLTFRDVGHRKHLQARLQHDAMHDSLTELPNRALFDDHLRLALNRRRRHPDQSCGVLLIDLNGVSELNRALGEAAGDILLVDVARRLRDALRPQDTAARTGGNEFAILVENVSSPDDLQFVAKRVLQELEQPFDLLGHFARMTASIGVAMARRQPEKAELLLEDARTAMFLAKQNGGHCYELFRAVEAPASAQH